MATDKDKVRLRHNIIKANQIKLCVTLLVSHLSCFECSVWNEATTCCSFIPLKCETFSTLLNDFDVFCLFHHCANLFMGMREKWKNAEFTMCRFVRLSDDPTLWTVFTWTHFALQRHQSLPQKTLWWLMTHLNANTRTDTRQVPQNVVGLFVSNFTFAKPKISRSYK